MYIDVIAWNAEDDPHGNYQHVVGAGEVTAQEVEEGLANQPGNHPDAYRDGRGESPHR